MLVMLSDCLLWRLGSADASWWYLPREGSASNLPADAGDACRWPVRRLSCSSKVPYDAGDALRLLFWRLMAAGFC